MTRLQAAIRNSWTTTIRRAIAHGDADAAYRLTRGLLRRLREIGVWL